MSMPVPPVDPGSTSDSGFEFDEDVPGFPRCFRCRYRLTGPTEQCVTCAHRALNYPDAYRRACGVCDQPLAQGTYCANRLCRDDRRRAFTRVYAIGLKERGSPLGQMIRRYKYMAKTGWALIFGRLLLGWLEQTMNPADVNLIVASPTYTGPPDWRLPHTEAVLDSAALQDARGLWPFDRQEPRAIVATGPRPQSAGASLAAKRTSAAVLATVLLVPDPFRVVGCRIIVYDDILTSGETMNAIAGALRAAGAAEVIGVVLARQTWSA